MESFWRNAGVQLGKHWKVVLVVVAVITVVLGDRCDPHPVRHRPGQLPQPRLADRDRQRRVPGQLRRRDGDPAVHRQRGGQATSPTSSSGANLDELDAADRRTRGVENVNSVITPLVSLTFSDSLVKGAGPGRADLGRRPRHGGRAPLAAPTSPGRARPVSAQIADQVLGDPAWNDLLIYGNDGFERRRRRGRPAARRRAQDPPLAGRHVPERREPTGQHHRGRRRGARRQPRPRRAVGRHPEGPRHPRHSELRGLRPHGHRLAGLPRRRSTTTSRVAC